MRLELVISIKTICQNARAIRERLAPGVKLIAVVKADAYGHGAERVANALSEARLADAFAVATPDEGASLREAGVTAPVIVLGCADETEARVSVRYGLSQAVCDSGGLCALEAAAECAGRRASAQLKVDTGMNRVGAKGDAALDALLDAWRRAKYSHMEGMFTHFAWADGDAEFTRAQFDSLLCAAERVRALGHRPYLHAAASSAIAQAEYALYAVRAGIALYGACAGDLAVLPAQTLVSRPVRLEWALKGETVGYNRAYTCARTTRVMTVPCGYGDGYPRLLSGRADVLVNGRRAPVIGNVCMDMLMVDVTDVGDIAPDAPVVLLGAQGGERITPDELALKAETIPYEIMLGFLPRVRRRWVYE